jgi:HEAT repeat protein
VKVLDYSLAAKRLGGLSPSELTAYVKQKLQRTQGIVLAEQPEGETYQLKIELGLGQEGSAVASSQKMLLISAQATNPKNVEGTVLQARSLLALPSEGTGAQLKPKFLKVVDATLEEIAFQAQLLVGPEEELVRVLNKPPQDVERLAAAIEMAAGRRSMASVSPLISLLKHREMQISDRAIGALVAIGDRRAVKPLTHLTKLSDTAHMAKILDAIGTLGGQEAKDFLEFIASGHDDEDIRNMAEEALRRLQKK